MRIAPLARPASGLRGSLGRVWTSRYIRGASAGRVLSVPLWMYDLAPSALRRAFAWRAEAAESAASTAVEPGHWLRPAMDRASGWAISPLTLLVLGRLLEERRPARILEFGGGVSTLAFASYARRESTSGRTVSVVSLEHDAGWLEKSRGMLVEIGLNGYADCVLAPLAETIAYGRQQVAYNPPASFQAAMRTGPGVDFVLIDGPPGAIGRLGSLALVEPHLADGATILLDDAFRPGERAAWAIWNRESSGRMHRSRIFLTSRGIASATWSSKGRRRP